MMLLPQAVLDTAQSVGERIRTAIARAPFEAGIGNPTAFTLSVGASEFGRDGATIDASSATGMHLPTGGPEQTQPSDASVPTAPALQPRLTLPEAPASPIAALPDSDAGRAPSRHSNRAHLVRLAVGLPSPAAASSQLSDAEPAIHCSSGQQPRSGHNTG